jgi:hypothetical protein
MLEIWNKLSILRNDRNIFLLNSNFNYFKFLILGLNDGISSIIKFYPYGSEFDNLEEEKKDKKFPHTFTLDDLENVGSSSVIYKFKTTSLINRILTAHLHEGFRYNSSRMIKLYGIPIKLGTVLYVEDKSYINPDIYDFAKRFLFIEPPNFPGYNWEPNVTRDDKGNEVYSWVSSYNAEFDYLNVTFWGPSGNTRWSFCEDFSNAKIGENLNGVRMFWDGKATYLINKNEIKSFTQYTKSDKTIDNIRMNGFDKKYSLKVVMKNGTPIDVDYTYEDYSSINTITQTKDYWIKLIFTNSGAGTYSQDSLNWIRNNAKVIIY